MHTNTFYLDTKQNGFTRFGRTLTRVMPLVYTKHVYSGRNRDVTSPFSQHCTNMKSTRHNRTLSSSNWSIHKHHVLFCSLAVLNPRVGHTMDVLSPFISVLCHSDWLFHGESCPCLDVVHPGRAWPSSPSCTWQVRTTKIPTKRKTTNIVQKNQIV